MKKELNRVRKCLKDLSKFILNFKGCPQELKFLYNQKSYLKRLESILMNEKKNQSKGISPPTKKSFIKFETREEVKGLRERFYEFEQIDIKVKYPIFKNARNLYSFMFRLIDKLNLDMKKKEDRYFLELIISKYYFLLCSKGSKIPSLLDFSLLIISTPNIPLKKKIRNLEVVLDIEKRLKVLFKGDFQKIDKSMEIIESYLELLLNTPIGNNSAVDSNAPDKNSKIISYIIVWIIFNSLFIIREILKFEKVIELFEQTRCDFLKKVEIIIHLSFSLNIRFFFHCYRDLFNTEEIDYFSQIVKSLKRNYFRFCKLPSYFFSPKYDVDFFFSTFYHLMRRKYDKWEVDKEKLLVCNSFFYRFKRVKRSYFLVTLLPYIFSETSKSKGLFCRFKLGYFFDEKKFFKVPYLKKDLLKIKKHKS